MKRWTTVRAVSTPQQSDMAALFSARVITVCGAPADLDEPPHPLEQPAVANAVEKRRRDFAAGRACARRALRQLGYEDTAVPAGDRREPVWPDGVVGTISHTQGFCGAAVARRTDALSLGFDAERVAAIRLDISDHVATEAELDVLQAALQGPRERALALAFSARESFYKCQYPVSRQWVGLRDVELRLQGECFFVVPRFDVNGICPRGGMVRGRYGFVGAYVMTAIELTAQH